MKLNKILILPLFSLIFLINNLSAHCPLCTIGAGAAAAGAMWLGVSKVVVSLFIGAFAMSMGMWFSKKIKKKYIPMQTAIIIISIFLLTVIPLLPIISKTHAFYISFFGNYGGLFNRTYTFNLSLFGSLLGGLIVFSTPSLSKKITRLRKNKIIPFQGVILTLLLLLIMGGILQIII